MNYLDILKHAIENLANQHLIAKTSGPLVTNIVATMLERYRWRSFDWYRTNKLIL